MSKLQLAGVKVIRVNDKQEVAHATATLYRAWNKPWDEHVPKLFQRFNTAQAAFTGTQRKVPRKVLAHARLVNQLLKDNRDVGAIGYKRAVAIATEFKKFSPLEMFTIMANDPERLKEIAGIGKVIANSLQRAVGGPTGGLEEKRLIEIQRRQRDLQRKIKGIT